MEDSTVFVDRDFGGGGCGGDLLLAPSMDGEGGDFGGGQEDSSAANRRFG